MTILIEQIKTWSSKCIQMNHLQRKTVQRRIAYHVETSFATCSGREPVLFWDGDIPMGP
jgi:hypothetical protein